MAETRTCPKCGSGTNTYRHPGAKVWCPKCGYVLREEGEQESKEPSDIPSNQTRK